MVKKTILILKEAVFGGNQVKHIKKHHFFWILLIFTLIFTKPFFSASLMPSIDSESSTDIINSMQNKIVPRLIIKNISISPDIVFSGEKFTLSYEIGNVNDEKPIHNIILYAQSDNNIILPVYGSSNSQYMESIPPNGTISGKIMLQASALADTNIYPINIVLEYQDTNGNYYRSEEIISLHINQKMDFIVEPISITEICEISIPTIVNVICKNNGKTIVEDINLHIEGNISKDDLSLYVGSMLPSAIVNKEISLSFTEGGEQPVLIYLTYKNSVGDTFQKELLNKTINITESSEIMDEKADVTENVFSLLNDKMFLTGLIFLIILVAYVLVFKKIFKFQKNKS